MASCRYCVQGVGKTDAAPSEKMRKGCSRAENEKDGGHFAKETEQIPRVERDESMEREALTKDMVPGLYLFLAKTTWQPVIREAEEETEHVI